MFRVVRGPDLTDKKTTTTPKTLNTEYKNNQSTVLKTKDFFDLVKNDNYNVNDNDNYNDNDNEKRNGTYKVHFPVHNALLAKQVYL